MKRRKTLSDAFSHKPRQNTVQNNINPMLPILRLASEYSKLVGWKGLFSDKALRPDRILDYYDDCRLFSNSAARARARAPTQNVAR